MQQYDLVVDSPLKRPTQPMINWKIFLRERKKEFYKLLKAQAEKKYTRSDFDFIQVLGKGAYGKVFLAKLRATGKEYAVKMIDKHKVVKSKRQRNAIQERKILHAINFPFCISLEMAFQGSRFSYLCLNYLPGGDMFTHLRDRNRFQESLSKFYGAQVVLALEYLHYLNLVHRDVKPENIVLDRNGYIKLTDFGLCKKLRDKRTYTFCGTPEYAAPEIILQKGHGNSVDWWSFGVLLFEMSAGYTPFHAFEIMAVYEKAVTGLFDIPRHFTRDLTNLVQNLLQPDLSKRYGNLKRGIDDIKGHPWFSSIDWMALFNFSIPAPYLPKIKMKLPLDDLEKLTDGMSIVSIDSPFLDESYDF